MPQKLSLYSKALIIAVVVAVIAVIVLYVYLQQQQAERIHFIHQNYGSTRGLIKSKHLRKNKMVVVYQVDGETYITPINFSSNVRHQIKAGDSISIKYSRTKPALILTAFEEGY